MFFDSRGCLIHLLAAAIALSPICSCLAKPAGPPHLGSPEPDSALGYYYSVVLPGLDLDDAAGAHSKPLKILRELADDKGFDYVGRAGSHKSAIVLRKDGAHMIEKRGSVGELENSVGMADSLCQELNRRYDAIGYGGVQCGYLPWKLRSLRGGGEDSGAESIFAGKKKNLGRSAPELHYPRSKKSAKFRSKNKRDSPVSSSDVIRNRKYVSDTLGIKDPRFVDQWHLFNSDIPGHDLQVASPWLAGVTGSGVNVAIIDDGVDFRHPDLVGAELSEGSTDLTRPSSPFSSTRISPYKVAHDIPSDSAHGTRCAGEIAARPNHYCGVGVAYSSKIASIKLMSSSSLVTDSYEASAISYASDINHIYTCSWGPPDDGSTVEAPGHLTLAAMEQNIAKGRDGLGSIYVFASGNGARVGDNCNYDGYVNDIRTITIASIDMYDEHPPYSEECPANLAVTYSSVNGTEGAIITSNPGGGCKFQTGTSASAPLAAALYAMALQVRKDLSWRDIQQLTIISAVPVSLSDDSWVENGSNLLYSNKYGYGKLRADYIVNLARSLKKLRELTSLTVPSANILPGGPVELHGPRTPTKVNFKVNPKEIEKSKIASLEQVSLEISLSYPHRGMLEYYLISPSGTHSKLASARPLDSSSEGLNSWRFSTVALWGEPIEGTWSLVVAPVNVVIPSDYSTKVKHSNPRLYSGGLKGHISALGVTFWGEKGTYGDSTFKKNLKMFHDIYPYNYKIEERDGIDPTYVFNENSYRSGSYDFYLDSDTLLPHRKGSEAHDHGDNRSLIIFYLSLVIGLLVLCIIIAIIVKLVRRRKANAPEKLPTSDPSDPLDPMNIARYQNQTNPEYPPNGQPSVPVYPDYFPLAGRPPPLSYDKMSTEPPHGLSYQSYPYQDAPPGYVYGINEYHKLPIRSTPGNEPDSKDP